MRYYNEKYQQYAFVSFCKIFEFFGVSKNKTLALKLFEFQKQTCMRKFLIELTEFEETRKLVTCTAGKSNQDCSYQGEARNVPTAF